MNSIVQFTQVSSERDVRDILELQAQNHASAVDAATAADQDFLTVRHDPAVLLRMNRAYPSVIAKAGERVVGYCLVMPRDFAADIPILAPMFALLETLSWRGLPLNDLRWLVMGQVCVAADFRGEGVFDGLYAKLRHVCRRDFDLVVTEIAERNGRSLRAHKRMGFETMHVYREDLTGGNLAGGGLGLGLTAPRPVLGFHKVEIRSTKYFLLKINNLQISGVTLPRQIAISLYPILLHVQWNRKVFQRIQRFWFRS